MELSYKLDSRGTDSRKHGHEARDKVKYHAKKEQKRASLTTFVDTRERAYVHLDQGRMKLSVVRLQGDRGYDEMTEDEKYSLITKAMVAKQAGQEDTTVHLKYEQMHGVNCQKYFKHIVPEKRTYDIADNNKDDIKYPQKGKKAAKRSTCFRRIQDECGQQPEDQTPGIC